MSIFTINNQFYAYMKIPILILSILCFFACSSEKSQEHLKSRDFSVKMDTVSVDAGDELIYVNWNLTSSGQSPDGKYLYNFKRTSPIALEVINLEQMKLEQIISLELEGQNGVGTEFISTVHVTPKGNFIFSDGYQLSNFDSDLNKINGIRFDREAFIQDKLEESQRLWFERALSEDGNKFVAFYGGQNMGEPKEGLMVIDFNDSIARTIPLEPVKSWVKHQTIFTNNGQPMNAVFSPVNVLMKGDSVVFSIGAENKAYFLDLSTDSLSSKTFHSQFTKSSTTVSLPLSVESEEEFREIAKAREKDVRYGKFLLDTKNQVYWRFTMESTEKPITVLTAFSLDFEQLGEKLLDENFVLPSKAFVRDGVIHTFLNLEDEVNFVRITPQFED